MNKEELIKLVHELDSIEPQINNIQVLANRDGANEIMIQEALRQIKLLSDRKDEIQSILDKSGEDIIQLRKEEV